MMLQRGHPPLLLSMQQHKPLLALGSFGGKSVSCDCISFAVIQTEGLCFRFHFFYHIVGVLEKDTHKQNHVMRGFCRSRGADVSHHTTHSWTLCNRAVARQRRSGRGMHDLIGWCEASMWLLNNTMIGEREVDTLLRQRDGKNRLFWLDACSQARRFCFKTHGNHNKAWPNVCQRIVACHFWEHK